MTPKHLGVIRAPDRAFGPKIHLTLVMGIIQIENGAIIIILSRGGTFQILLECVLAYRVAFIEDILIYVLVYRLPEADGLRALSRGGALRGTVLRYLRIYTLLLKDLTIPSSFLVGSIAFLADVSSMRQVLPQLGILFPSSLSLSIQLRIFPRDFAVIAFGGGVIPYT